jgi:hypothetical protein
MAIAMQMTKNAKIHLPVAVVQRGYLHRNLGTCGLMRAKGAMRSNVQTPTTLHS